jgi:proteasome lid subunit RPN8/RPN11
MLPNVCIDPELRAELAAACRAEPAREFVGLVGGRCSAGALRATAWVRLSNVAAHELSFLVVPGAFVGGEAALRARELAWLGFVHSHVRAGALLSHADREHLWRDCLQFVASAHGGTFALRGFAFAGGAWHPLPAREPAAAAAT